MENPREEPLGALEQVESHGPLERPHPPVPYWHALPLPCLPSPRDSIASTEIPPAPPGAPELEGPDLPTEPLLPGPPRELTVPPRELIVPPMVVPPMQVPPMLGQRPPRSPAPCVSTSPVPPIRAGEEPQAVQEQSEERVLLMECSCCALTCIRVRGRLGRPQ